MLYEMVHDNHFTYGDPCINPTDDEMIADGWFKDADGVWAHPDLPKPTPVCDTDYDPDIPF